MKVIKLYGWEIPFISKVNTIRDSEINMLKNISYISAFTSFLWTSAPFLVSFVTFALYVMVSDQNVLDAKKAFVSLSLFNLLRFPLTMLPQMITSVVMASVSVTRLNKFLNSSQLDTYITRNESDTDAINIEGGVFVWESDTKKEEDDDKTTEDETNKTTEETNQEDIEKKLVNGAATELKNGNGAAKNGNANASNGSKIITLNGINLTVKKGSLVAIVGHVGSGKSSLLSAILGDMERVEGTVNVARDETVAYVAQQAWIRNATLRENILFGSEYIKSTYDSIIEMCALKPDIAILAGKDETEIGEKGINLSGGQKQRVAIARACYQPSSLVLFDDPLSAVDSHVAKHIFQKVLSNTSGYLRDRTRVLVTNNISLLPDVDHIVVLSGGQISETGTYHQLLSNNGKFAEFVHEHSNEKPEDNDELDTSADQSSSSLRRNRTMSSGSESKSASLNRQKSVAQEQEQQKLIEAERAETGNVKWSIYSNYFRSLTFVWLTLMFLGFVGMQIASVGSSVWLAVWSNDNTDEKMFAKMQGNDTLIVQSEDDIKLRNMRLTVYGLLGLFQGKKENTFLVDKERL